jgi:hypothetical protein
MEAQHFLNRIVQQFRLALPAAEKVQGAVM